LKNKSSIWIGSVQGEILNRDHPTKEFPDSSTHPGRAISLTALTWR